MGRLDTINARLHGIVASIEEAKRKLALSDQTTAADLAKAADIEKRYRAIKLRLAGELEMESHRGEAKLQPDLPVPLLEQTNLEHELAAWLIDIDKRFKARPHRVQSASV